MNFSATQSSTYSPQPPTRSGADPFSDPYGPLRLQTDTKSPEWSSSSELEPDTPSLARSSWGSGGSVSSTALEYRANQEQYHPAYFPDIPNHASKTALRYSELMNVTLPSLFGKEDPLKAASVELDKVHYDLVAHEKKFIYPSDLRFSIGFGSSMLADVEKYKPVLEHLRKLDELQIRLARVSTYGNVQLKDKRARTSSLIESAIRIIKERRLKLYEQAVESALDNIILDLSACVKQFKYPPKLDFPMSSDGGQFIADTEGNQLFINQLRKLDGFREKVNNLPAYGDEQLEDKRKRTGMAIERARQKMNKHQLNLYHHRRTKPSRS